MNIFQRLRERFWVIPALMCGVAAVAAELLISVDERGSLDLPSGVDRFLYRVGESGSRDVLATIAGSSLAVAGTTFSITMAVLALTSSSYGPRLIRNFMADRANQVVLGVYVATFLYSLLVLRAVRVIGDPSAPDADAFVPHLAVNGAVLLAVLDVAVLIYFIHHISDSIQISTIAGRVRAELASTVDRLYPEHIGRDRRDVRDDLDTLDRLSAGAPVEARRSGYIGYIQDDDLLQAARTHDVVLALQVRPGRYVLDDTVLCLAHPPERATAELEDAVRSAIAVSNARSPHQDVDFAVQQLTELAVRALSPGTNDPFTAINALDDLSSGLARMAGRELPSAARFDQDGVMRVHAPHEDAVALTTTVVDHMRWYAAASPSVMRSTLDLVHRVGRHLADRSSRVRLQAQLRPLVEAFEAAGHHSHDVEDFARRARDVDRMLSAHHSDESD